MHRKKAKRNGTDKRIVSVCSPMRAGGVTLTAAALSCALAENSSATFAETKVASGALLSACRPPVMPRKSRLPTRSRT